MMAFNNAMFNPIRPQNMGAGIYPGSGVAQGGQQGRMGMMTNGFGGVTPGGTSYLASSRRPYPSRSPAQPAITGSGKGPFPSRSPISNHPPYIPSNHSPSVEGIGPYPVTGMPPVTAPDLPHFGHGVVNAHGLSVLGQGHGGPGAIDPFAQYADTGYQVALNNARYQYGQQANPILAQLDALRSHYISNPDGSVTLAKPGMTGRTVYDLMYQQAQDNFNRSLLSSNHQAAARGLSRSGYHDLQKVGMQDQFNQNTIFGPQSLFNTQGQGAINQLQQQQGTAQQQQNLQLANARLQAIGRYLQRHGQSDVQTQKIYESIFPSGRGKRG